MEMKDLVSCNNCGVVVCISEFNRRELDENVSLYKDKDKYDSVKGVLFTERMSHNTHFFCPVCKKINQVRE